MNRFVVLNGDGEVYSCRSEKSLADKDAVEATSNCGKTHGVYELLYTVVREVSVKVIRSPASPVCGPYGGGDK